MPWNSVGGGGFDYVTDTQPSNPEIGETWYDSAATNGATKIYADLGGGAAWHVLPTQRELQEGRTRELLLLLQDKPVPEVQDPLNIQDNLTLGVITDNDVTLGKAPGSGIETEPDSSNDLGYEHGWTINPNKDDIVGIQATVSTNSQQANINNGTIEVRKASDSSTLASKDIGAVSRGDVLSIDVNLSANTDYYVLLTNDFTDYDYTWETNLSFPVTGDNFDLVNGFSGSEDDRAAAWEKIELLTITTSGYATDQFAAPTTAPADFKQWVSINPQDVSEGGSTSANPVEFEILDSSDTVLTSARIPLSEMPFNLKGRAYSTNAGADDQSDYTIPQTGAGGHFGLPTLSVVTVSVAGSVIDPENWQFDGVDTIQIDTSTIGVETGDEIEIVYDVDVFDSTLQPRAYLSRESTSETSPSISHFRYEYVI